MKIVLFWVLWLLLALALAVIEGLMESIPTRLVQFDGVLILSLAGISGLNGYPESRQ